jgi:hypothetical protein
VGRSCPLGGLILSVACGTLTGMSHPESVPQASAPLADQGVEVPPLVVEATRKAGLVWIGVPGQPRPTPVWFTWTDGGHGAAVYVVTGPGEQPLPGIFGALRCTVSVPSADKHGRIASWTASVHQVEPGSAEWDAIVPGMLTKRLNLPDGAAAAGRWARECAVLRLAPTGELTEAGSTLPADSLAAPPAPSPARSPTRVPFTLHRKPRRRAL